MRRLSRTAIERSWHARSTVASLRIAFQFGCDYLLAIRQLALVVWGLVLSCCPIYSQGYDPYGMNVGRFNEANPIGAAAIDHGIFYCSWPEWSVETPCVTAVDLATGKPVWTQHGRLAMPHTFKIDETWLEYETTDGDQVAPYLTDGLRTLHLVDLKSGRHTTIPTEVNRRSVVEECLVHQDRCLTFQGMVVNCADGAIIGDLGPGEHQAIAANGNLIAVTRVLKEDTFQYDKCLLREFRIADMKLEREMEIASDVTWTLAGTRGDYVLAWCEFNDHLPQIGCFDLDQKTERWRTELPRGVRINHFSFPDDSHAMFALGYHGPIWPLLVNLESGAISPVDSWRDPQWMLSWHNQNGRLADMIASNSKVIIGKWRLQNMLCIDATTGKRLWDQRSVDHLVTRVFCERPRLGDYLVAETERGFDIINVESGERHSIVPENLGLKRVPKPIPETLQETDERPTSRTASLMKPLFLGSTSNDWMFDQGIFVLLAIPILIWAIWAVVRWNSARSANQSVIRK